MLVSKVSGLKGDFLHLNQEGTPADQFEYDLSDSQVTITRYKGTDANVIIPDTIEGYPVKRIGGSTFKGNSEITEIIISNGVIEIRGHAFDDCSSLSKIVIPETVIDINDCYLLNCSKL